MELNAKEDRCMREALAFVKDVANKYSLREPFTKAPSDVGIASNGLVANVAYEKYRTCVADRSK